MRVTISCSGKYHAFYLAEQLDKHGYLSKLITPFYSNKRGYLPEFRRDKEQINPSKVVTNILPELIRTGFGKVPIIRNFYNWNFYSLELFDNWAKRHIGQCDLLVAWACAALNTIKKARSCGVKTIVERGSTHILYQKEILKEEYDKFGINFNAIDSRVVQKELDEYNETDYISVPSNFAAQTYIEKGINPKKIIQIPYGVDISLFKPILKEDKLFRVIHCGGVSLRKGVQYLLQAFIELDLPNSELWLVGGISEEFKPTLAKYNYPKVIIKGKQLQSSLPWFYSQCSAFCLASIEEGLAMVIPQAMACGLPVICTTNTGGEEMIRDRQDGFIIPIRDVEAIKQKILYLYENPQELETMSKSARQRVEKEFSWDNYGEKIISQYQKILSSASLSIC